MRIFGLCALMLAGLTVATPEAEATSIGNGNPFGLGVIGGYPTGLSGKYYLGGRSQAIDGAVAFGNYDWSDRGFYLHLDYLWHPSVLANGSGFELTWHVGVGGLLSTYYYGWYGRWDGRTNGAVRVPIGLDLDLNDPRFQFFLDGALLIYVVPGTAIDIAPSGGIRYYF